MTIPIHNASDVLLTSQPGTLPNMRDALTNWFQLITFTQITKTVVNFQLVETQTQVSFQGVVEPIPPQRLMIKPEGQRKWRWQNVWAYPDSPLNIDDIIIYDSVSYRVMTKTDWTRYGYVQFEIMEDYGT